MNIQDPLLADIRRYCDVAGIAQSTFGSLAVKDSRFVERLREGKVTLRSLERVRLWIEQNPPDEAAA